MTILRKVRVALMAALLVATLGAGLALTPVSAATTYTGNLAGRPIGGDANTSCHGMAYGKVGGSMVLFTAAHCRGANGQAVIAPNGATIGIWTSDSGAWGNDLTYIWLYTGNWPSDRHIVYSGNGGYAITIDPPSGLGCFGEPNYVNNPIYEAWQSSSTSTYLVSGGTVKGFVSGDQSPPCVIKTSIPQHVNPPTLKDSGAPFLLGGYLNTVFGTASVWWDDNGTHRLGVSPMYDGLQALRNEGKSVVLCHNAGCTNT